MENRDRVGHREDHELKIWARTLGPAWCGPLHAPVGVLQHGTPPLATAQSAGAVLFNKSSYRTAM